ncbi:MAG TPA: 2-dehydropantoate 2-reductase [Isosphaeraceae bacterium]|nr:2-dehydropantoate 2-reductase [Isosphaeraceae bacterium]
MLKTCIVGAGAIGGMLGVQLALAGEHVTFISRGANLEAVRRNGLRLILDDGTESLAQPVMATESLAEAGPQDLVILSVKAHQVPAMAQDLPVLFGPDTIVVTMQNGIPWWYFLKCQGPYQGMRLEAVDPGGVIAAHIAVDRVIGCVAYPAAERIAPGVIRHIEGNRFSVGELDGAETPRVKMVSELFRKAGFKAPVLTDIRSEIWLKLWGNLSFNPISALTHATLVEICRFPPTRELAARMMAEAQAIAEKLGIHFRVSLERRIAGAEGVGKHKTSMLQDLEQGRALELEALVGAVVELGRITGTPTPHIDAVYACTSLLARTVQAEKGRLRIETLGT